jgi:hypothetical protein
LLCWFFLIARQPTLIHRGNVRMHGRPGAFNPLLVVLSVTLAIPVVQLDQV